MPDLVAVRRPSSVTVLADLVGGTLLRDLFLVVGAAGFVGALAQLSFHLSFTPVPITGQTLGVLLAGTALGWKRGFAAMMLYGVAGLFGVPWFADHASGYVGASFGYIIGFVLCATLCGYFAEKGADRSVRNAIWVMVLGEIVLYTVGVTWLKIDLHVSFSTAISLGFTPFIIGDAIKAAIAAILLPGAWRYVDRK